MSDVKKYIEQQRNIEIARRKDEAGRLSTRFIENKTFLQKIFDRTFKIFVGVTFPIFKFFVWILTPIFRFYKGAWSRNVYSNDEYGNRFFRPVNALVFIIGTFILWSLIGTAINLTYYSTLYALTNNTHELIYMTNSQEVDSDNDIFSAQGCESLPCNQDTAIYFRIQATLFNHLYNYWHEGSMFYSDFVAASIPPTVTKCKVTSYGFRFKLLMRNSEIYPYLLSAECSPVLDD